jgi:hypothetical protein
MVACQARAAEWVFGIALGYKDLVHHNQPRHDPVMATLAGKLTARRTDCAPLAGKSTLDRLEHPPFEPSRYHKIGHDGSAIERLFVHLFQGVGSNRGQATNFIYFSRSMGSRRVSSLSDKPKAAHARAYPRNCGTRVKGGRAAPLPDPF